MIANQERRFAPYILGAMLALAMYSGGAKGNVYSHDEPIAYIGHGAMFSKAGNEIAPTRAFVSQAQLWYIHALGQRLTGNQQVEFSTFKNQLENGLVLDAQSRLVLNSRLMDWLLEKVPLPDADRLRGKNNLLKFLLQKQLPESAAGASAGQVFTMNAELQLRLESHPLTSPMAPVAAPISPVKDGGAAYRTDCTNAGVPVPPDFGPGSPWITVGTLTTPDLFISRSLNADVQTWTSAAPAPAGQCIALPRYDPKTMLVSLDGVICVGMKTSNACFYDNEVNGKAFTFKLGTKQAFAQWGGGADLANGLGGVCSDCHAGDNPFVVHGAVLEKASVTPPNWYLPIVGVATPPWPLNPGPLAALPADCQGCHNLPLLSTSLPGYCATVLRSSIGALGVPVNKTNLNPNTSMPPAAPGSLVCTPNVPVGDPRYQACAMGVQTKDCTPAYPVGDPRRGVAFYNVSCSADMANLLTMCTAAAPPPPPPPPPPSPSPSSSRPH